MMTHTTAMLDTRALATRPDKLTDRCRETVSIADIFIWLRARPDQAPR